MFKITRGNDIVNYPYIGNLLSSIIGNLFDRPWIQKIASLLLLIHLIGMTRKDNDKKHCFWIFFNRSCAVVFWLEWKKFIVYSIGAKNCNGKNNTNEIYETYATTQNVHIIEFFFNYFFNYLTNVQVFFSSVTKMIYLKWKEYQGLDLPCNKVHPNKSLCKNFKNNKIFHYLLL